jgi:single-strand DNA-binding protein
MAKSLNRVQLIGNLTRDPELRYTPSGKAVCSIGLATNRSWTTETGEKHDEPEFHRIIAWNKLAELCSQFLVKGRKIYVEGRLSTRNWTTQEGQQRSVTEVVIDDMILLDKAGATDKDGEVEKESTPPAKPVKKEAPKEEKAKVTASDEEVVPPDDIPF